MKKITSVLLCLLLIYGLCIPAFAFQTGAAYYIDAVNGNDANDGTSPDRAWKSAERVNEHIFSPGDSLLIKRGQTHNGNFIPKGSGSENSPVTVSAYGEGNAPVIHANKGEFLFLIHNISNWEIENLEFTSDEYGLYILAHSGYSMKNITVRNCYFHDINPTEKSTNYSAIHIDTQRGNGKISGIHLDSLRIENVAWGIHTSGLNAEDDSKIFVNSEESYNRDYLIENTFIKNAKCGGIVLSAVFGGVIRNCRVLDSATAQDSAYAPLWLRHCDGVTVEYCEIAGATNKTDGMAIDFDGWTVNSTYRYIYSHDNTRFMKNCVFDRKTKNSGNTVNNCISVNDNKRINWGAISLISLRNPSFGRMSDFNFHDNVIINGTPILWTQTKNPQIENISFSGSPLTALIQKILNIFLRLKNFSYTEPADEDINMLINNITANLPE